MSRTSKVLALREALDVVRELMGAQAAFIFVDEEEGARRVLAKAGDLEHLYDDMHRDSEVVDSMTFRWLQGALLPDACDVGRDAGEVVLPVREQEVGDVRQPALAFAPIPVENKAQRVVMGAVHDGDLDVPKIPALCGPLATRVEPLLQEISESESIHDDLEAFAALGDDAIEVLLAGMEDGVLMLDAHARVVLANDAAEALLHGQVEVGEVLSETIAKGLMTSFLFDGEGFEGVWTFVESGEGEGRYLRVTGKPLHDGLQGTIVGALCVFRDITSNVEREEALHRTLREREAMADAIPGVTLQVSYDGCIRSVDVLKEERWRVFNERELVGEDIRELRPAALAQVLYEHIEEIAQRGSVDVTRSFEWEAHVGEKLHVYQVRLVATGAREVLVYLRDVTDKRRMEELLTLTQFAVDHAPDSVFWTDADGHIVYVNHAAIYALGYADDRLVGKNYGAINPSLEGEEWEELWEELEDAIGVRFETSHVRADGERFPVELSASRIEHSGREYVCLFARDVTQRKQAEEEFRAYAERLKQSNRELQDFAYVASHDLQEPLRKILAFGDRLGSRYEEALDERGADYLARMQRAASRMSRLIDDLLRFSRVTTRAEPFERCDLNEIARGVLFDLNLRIEETEGHVDIGELPAIEADPTQMRQVFQNLISNALKFAKPNVAPEVTIRARTLEEQRGARPDEQERGSTLAPRRVCEIIVTDNGIGFDEKYADKIFAPFQRLHGRTSAYKGTGIGLAICRKIVERHDGAISVTSEVGEGTTFRLELPLVHNH